MHFYYTLRKIKLEKFLIFSHLVVRHLPLNNQGWTLIVALLVKLGRLCGWVEYLSEKKRIRNCTDGNCDRKF